MKTMAAAAWATVLCLGASEALACSIIIPPPRPGENMRQAVIRMERAQQQRLRAAASHVYLARVVREDQGLVFTPVLTIDGSAPPREVSASRSTNCEPSDPMAGELRIVFARRTGRADHPWKPWRWGEGVALGSRQPGEVVDLDLAQALGRAARND